MKKTKPKIFKKCSVILLTAALTAVSLNSVCVTGSAIDKAEQDTITVAPKAMSNTLENSLSENPFNPKAIIVAPKNMLNVQVKDKNGNDVDNLYAALKDSSGSTVASWYTGSNEVNSADGYEISGQTFFEEQKTFEELVAPYPLVRVTDINEPSPTEQNWVRFNSGQKRTLKLEYLEDHATDLTVNQLSMAIVVDPGWKTSAFDSCNIQIKDLKYDLKQIAGTTKQFIIPPNFDNYNDPTFLNIDGSGSRFLAPERNPEQTEYYKTRLKLSDIDSHFTDNGTYIDDNGKVYDYKKNTSSKTVAFLIISGSVINAPIPDANGTVEIYVEKSTRAIRLDGMYIWTNNSGGTIGASRTVFEQKTYVFQAVSFPTEGTNLSNVPSGTYTLEISGRLDGQQRYKSVTQTVVVQDSNEFQMHNIVLEDAVTHTHTADSNWLSDTSNHWHKCNSCAENVQLDIAPHTPGPEATETTPQTCTVCGYEIAPKLPHVHNYGNEYKSDENRHWKECSCKAVTDDATHDFFWVTDKEATESEAGSKHEECSVCHYKKSAVAIPVIKPAEPDTKEPDTEPTTNQEPTTANQEPTTTNQEPTTTNQEPTTINQEPTTTNQELTTNPATETKKQTSQTSSPVTGDNISTTLLILILASVALFGGIMIAGNNKKSSKNI